MRGTWGFFALFSLAFASVAAQRAEGTPQVASTANAQVEVVADSVGQPIRINGVQVGVTPAVLLVPPTSGARVEVGSATRMRTVTLDVPTAARLRIDVIMPRDTQPIPVFRSDAEIERSLDVANRFPPPPPPPPRRPVRPAAPLVRGSIMGGVLLTGAAFALAPTLCEQTFVSPAPSGGYVGDVYYAPGTHSLGMSTPCTTMLGVGALIGGSVSLHALRHLRFKRATRAFGPAETRWQADELAFREASARRAESIRLALERAKAQELERRREVVARNEQILRANREPPQVTVLSAPGVVASAGMSVGSALTAAIPSARTVNPDAFAIIIGNRSYRSAPSVTYASNDAAVMRQYAERTLGIRPGNIFELADATKSTLEDFFGIQGNPNGRLKDLVVPGRSEVFIFYSGHGAPDPESQKAYLMPVDANANRLAITGYSLDLLYENLAALKARHVTVVLDACFSGGTAWGEMLITAASPIGIRFTDPSARFAAENATVITAATGQQLANWHLEQRHGLLTYFFLKGLQGSADLNGDGRVAVEEMKAWLQDGQGLSYEARRLFGREQMPQVWGDGAWFLRP